MKRFEYAIVSLEFDAADNDRDNSDRARMRLDDLGADGWELVALKVDRELVTTFYMKREIV